MMTELFSAESKTQVYAALHELLSIFPSIATTLSKEPSFYPLFPSSYLAIIIIRTCVKETLNSGPCHTLIISFLSFIEFICYDDACHLRRYANNPKRRNITTTSQRLTEIELVVDKMHMAGHVDEWCHAHCDPRKFVELQNVSLMHNTFGDSVTSYGLFFSIGKY